MIATRRWRTALQARRRPSPKPRAARPKVKDQRRVVSFQRLVAQVSARYGAQTAAAWTKAVLKHQADINETALRSALASKNRNAIEAAIGITKLQATAQRAIAEPLIAATRSTGTEGARIMTRAGVGMRFNAAHPNVAAFAREQAADLVRDIPKQAKRIIGEVIARGASAGLTIEEQARAIREVVGLPPAWARAPQALAEDLREGRISAATGRRLSAATKQQIRSRANAGTLTDSFIKTVTKEYSESLVNRRALNIARTESHRAANHGLVESWKQAQAQGVLPEGARRFWIITPDDRLCVPPRTPVLTVDGWRAISKIKPGDYVLTKEDRFKKVLNIFSRRYDGEVGHLEFGPPRMRVRVTATFGHLIFTDKGWIPIEEIDLTTKVRILAVPCPDCGELIARGPGGPSKRKYYCRKCGHDRVILAASMPEARAKAIATRRANGRPWVSASQHKKNRQHRHSVETRRVLSAKAKTRKSYPFRDVNTLRKALLAQTTDLEKKVQGFLEAQGIAFEREWPFDSPGTKLGKSFADFFLPGPRVVIECDGFSHWDPKCKAHDAKRDAVLREQGITVLRLDGEVIRHKFHEVASAIRQHCCFMWLTPRKITHAIIAHQSMHDLEVEDDCSFVAGGVVVHNSPEHAQIPGMNPDGRGMDEPFVTPDGEFMYPPSRPNCRCSIGLMFTPVSVAEEDEDPLDRRRGTTRATPPLGGRASRVFKIAPRESGAPVLKRPPNFAAPDDLPLAASGQLPLARGAQWKSLEDPARTKRFLEGMAYDPDAFISMQATRELEYIATNPRFVLKAPTRAHFGIGESLEEIQRISSTDVAGVIRFRGVRSLAMDAERAARYAGQRGTTFEVLLPKGARAVRAEVAGLPEMQMLPGSRFRVVSTSTREGRTHVKLKLVDDGTENTRRIVKLKKELAEEAGRVWEPLRPMTAPVRKAPGGKSRIGGRPPGASSAVSPEARDAVSKVLLDMDIKPTLVQYKKLGNASVGKVEGMIGGEYRNGKIVLNPNLPASELPGFAVHEAQHLKFDVALRGDAKLKQEILDDFEGLRRDDGVTEYSSAHWKQVEAAYADGVGSSLAEWERLLAVNETLAEMRLLSLQGMDIVAAPRYRALLKRVDAAYRKAAGKKFKPEPGARALRKIEARPLRVPEGPVQLAPSTEYVTTLRTELRQEVQKALARGSLTGGSEAVTDLAYRSSDLTTFAMAQHVEAKAGRQAMLRALASGTEWNTQYAVASNEWLAAHRLGANQTMRASTKTAVKARAEEFTDEMRAAMEARTQFVRAWAKQNYGDEITVYRGVKGKQAKQILASGAETVELDVYGLSSWTTSRSKARAFAGNRGVLLETKVKAKDVFWSNALGAKGIVRFADDSGELVVTTAKNARTARVAWHGGTG